jgi:hypothetical protein
MPRVPARSTGSLVTLLILAEQYGVVPLRRADVKFALNKIARDPSCD